MIKSSKDDPDSLMKLRKSTLAHMVANEYRERKEMEKFYEKKLLIHHIATLIPVIIILIYIVIK